MHKYKHTLPQISGTPRTIITQHTQHTHTHTRALTHCRFSPKKRTDNNDGNTQLKICM